MNTIYYKNAKGEQRTVKVGQGGSDWFDQNSNRRADGKLPIRAPKRRPTMAEADEQMFKAGFHRRSDK